MQVLQAVHHRHNADALLELLQLRRNGVGRQPFLIPQAQGFPDQDALPLGPCAGIHEKYVLKPTALGRQPGTLIGSRQAGAEQNGHHLVPGLFGGLKHRKKSLRAGLAGAGQLLFALQTGVIFIAGNLPVQHGGAVRKGHGQRHHIHIGPVGIDGRQIGGRISQNADHSGTSF